MILVSIFASNNASAKPSDNKKCRISWSYAGRNYSLELELNSATWQDYQHSPRPANPRPSDAYYRQYFLKKNGDNAIAQLDKALTGLAATNGLSDTDLMEFALAFIQALPYDNAKINSKCPRLYYPFETLYRGMGSCLDKALLGKALMEEWQIASAMIYFPSIPQASNNAGRNIDHVCLALGSDSPFASFQGYLYLELSAPAPFGQVPHVKGDHLETTEGDPYGLTDCERNTKNMGNYFILLPSTGYKF